jgi:acetyl-CoA carboxylase/biotin carboxylase 1
MDKLSVILKQDIVIADLRAAGVKVISCIVQRDGALMPMRRTFLLSEERLCYEEEPILRHVEPPLSSLLELVCNTHQTDCTLS